MELMQFPNLDIGFNTYREEVLRRSEYGKRKKYTAFKDFRDFLPPEIEPNQDIFMATRTFNFEKAKKFIDFLAVLKHWGGPPISGKDTDSSYSIRLYMPNILFMYWFDKTYIVPNGKIQLEPYAIRCNIDRAEYKLLSKIEKIIGPLYNIERNDKGVVESSDSIKNEFYWTQYVVPFCRRHKLTTKQIMVLKLRWDTIGQQYAPGYNVIPCNLKEAAAHLPITAADLLSELDNIIKRGYEWEFSDSKRNLVRIPHIEQCSELLGRKFIICTKEKYFTIFPCHHCHNNTVAGVGFAETNACQDKGVVPIGKTVFVILRNEFSKTVKKKIKERDEPLSPPCLIGRITKDNCMGEMVYCHVASARDTKHKLDERDGFWGCVKHNLKQGNSNLLIYLPEAKTEAERLKLRV